MSDDIRGIPAATPIKGNGVEERNLRIEGYVGKDDFLKRLRPWLETREG